jgi:hypothetical protein
MNIKAQMGKFGIILILIVFILLWFGGLGSALSSVSCTNALAGSNDGLWNYFACNFFGFGVAIFVIIAFVAVVFV